MKNTVTMERCSLGMEKLGNARQLGGYVAGDGRAVRDGALLRSGKLIDATAADIHRLRSVYRLTTVVDLRTEGEMAKGPDPQIEGVANHHIRVLEEGGELGGIAKGIVGANRDIDETVKGMLMLSREGHVNDQLYVSVLDSASGRRGFRLFFDLLLKQRKDSAFLWHCTSGKDRTGLAAVLLLTALGVDRETALRDFELSNEFHARNIRFIMDYTREFTDDPDEIQAMVALAGVSSRYMENVYTFAEERHGSLLGYIRSELGVTDEEICILRDKYLV